MAAQKVYFYAEHKKVRVFFSAASQARVPLEVYPLTLGQDSQPGGAGRAEFRFANHGKTPIHIRAAHRLTPEEAEPFFTKVACFCFDLFTLQPEESKDFTVAFMIHRQLPQEIAEIYLHYDVFTKNHFPTAVK